MPQPGARPSFMTGRERRATPRLLSLVLCALAAAAAQADDKEPLALRAWGVPTGYELGYVTEAERAVMAAFRKAHPHIRPVSTRGLIIPSGFRTNDMVPLMQIAGDIAPDVLMVTFRQSQTYIDKRLLLALDAYVEQMAGVRVPDGPSLSNAAYLNRLEQGTGWPAIAARVPPQCWPVMRRPAPDGSGRHVYLFPAEAVVAGLQYDRAMFAEHAELGVETRPPRDWEEMLRWGKVMTDPARGKFGMHVWVNHPGPMFANLVYAAGGELMSQDEHGRWHCTLDSDAAEEAGLFWARLRLEKVERDGRLVCRGIIRASESETVGAVRNAMMYVYLSVNDLDLRDETKAFGPVPAGPTGLQRSELNARLVGIFSGLAHDARRRDAAWDYIRFYDSPTARRLRVARYIDVGLGHLLPRQLVADANVDGRYDGVLRRIRPETDATYRIAHAGGVPEPYGPNCSMLYDVLRLTIEAIWHDAGIRAAIDAADHEGARRIIRAILARGAVRIERSVLGRVPAPTARRRERVAWAAIAAVVVAFALVLHVVWRAFTPPADLRRPGRWFGRHARAYVLAAPALLLIALWMYWPMVKGSAIAFQDYSVLGDSRWIGAANFADVLFDPQFWYSVRISLLYAGLYMLFGFGTPIGLALLLSEVPRGKVVFRSLYYLPAVLSGAVVIFLWKTFYSPAGMVNQVLNGAVGVLNLLPGVALAPFAEDWLQNPSAALACCLLPVIWAGMGPGCLIYLAALKTIPEELYEAADIDGAGLGRKLTAVTFPTIRVLVVINFIGAMIGAVRGSGSFVLAMTGGGPYTEAGGVTEVIGLRLFYTTFGYLRFGVGAAMAWVIGAMLIGFTVFQLKRLSQVEFRAGG